MAENNAKIARKLTELGELPSDWSVCTLADLSACSMQNGLFFEPARKGKGIRLINVGDLYCEKGIDVEALELFDASRDQEQRYAVLNGDLFFTRSSIVPSGIAYCNIFTSKQAEKVVFDSHVIRLRPDSRIVFPEYVFRACRGRAVRRQLISSAKTGTMTTVDQNVLRGCPIPLPPTLKEQQAIAEALSDADGLIESLEKLIAKKRLIKQGAMQELLTGKKRLPGFSKSWSVKRVGALLEVMHGRGQHAVEDNNGDYPILATGGQIGTANAYLYNKPSVLIGRKGTIDRPIYMDKPFWTVDTLFYSRVFDTEDAKFLYYRFLLIPWMQYNEASGVPSLNASTIENIEISVPEKDEQEAVASFLSAIDSELSALEQKLAKARQVKQGMMQELLTGRIRLI